MFAERKASDTMNSKFLLIVAGILIFIGLTKPNIGNILPINNPVRVDSIVVITPPSDSALKDQCQNIIEILKGATSSDRAKDGKRLSELYMDLATLIELDKEDEIIKTTEEIRQANSLSGLMLRMNIQGKYPGLGDAAHNVMVSQIGEDVAPLDAGLRQKAVDAFRALAWAFNEGTK